MLNDQHRHFLPISLCDKLLLIAVYLEQGAA